MHMGSAHGHFNHNGDSRKHGSLHETGKSMSLKQNKMVGILDNAYLGITE